MNSDTNDSQKLCVACKKPLKTGKVYCSRTCYAESPRSAETRTKMSQASLGIPKTAQHSANISAGKRGKPRPWARGAGNPNFGNRAQGRPEARARYLAAMTIRGSTANPEKNQAHSIRMLGPSNAMRGKKHTEAYKAKMSEIIKNQYRNGRKSKLVTKRISNAEKEILAFLQGLGIQVITQYSIPGETYFYDFFLVDKNLLIEYNGDYWHANPKKYQDGSLLSFRGGARLVNDIWKRDVLKKEAAERHGIRLVCIWESDYKLSGLDKVKELLV